MKKVSKNCTACSYYNNLMSRGCPEHDKDAWIGINEKQAICAIETPLISASELDALRDELLEVKRYKDDLLTKLHSVKVTLNKLGAATYYGRGNQAAVKLQPFERIEWLDSELRKLSHPATRPEPSRLEIAAMIYAAWESCSDAIVTNPIQEAFKCADALIAEARKEVAK